MGAAGRGRGDGKRSRSDGAAKDGDGDEERGEGEPCDESCTGPASPTHVVTLSLWLETARFRTLSLVMRCLQIWDESLAKLGISVSSVRIQAQQTCQESS